MKTQLTDRLLQNGKHRPLSDGGRLPQISQQRAPRNLRDLNEDNDQEVEAAVDPLLPFPPGWDRKRPPAPRPVSGPRVITQSELQRLLELVPLAKQCSDLWESVRKRLVTGAAVEQGPVAASIRFESSQRLTKHRLIEALGETAVEEILSIVEATPCRRLTISVDGEHDLGFSELAEPGQCTRWNRKAQQAADGEQYAEFIGESAGSATSIADHQA